MRETSGVSAMPADEQTVRWRLLTLFIGAASQSAHLRVCRSIDRDVFGHASFGDERLHDYYKVLDTTRKSLAGLARYCRENHIDPQQHALFPMLDLRAEFLAAYENGRSFEADHLTPALIHEAGAKGWRIHYNGWTIQRTGLTEMDDHYGQPTYGYPLHLTGPAGECHTLEMPGLTVERARDAYMLIAGHRYGSNDGLGQDPEHPAERCA